MTAASSKKTVPVVPILVLALALRLWNLGFGLPDWYHPDEPLKARIVARMANGDLDPQYFFHPSFMLYASAATLRGVHLFGAPLDDQSAVRAGRLTVALLGTATVLLTYALARRVGGHGIASFAALLLAVSPLHVVCSHYLKEDVPLTFWALAAFLCSLRIVDRGRSGDYMLAGLFAGVAAGTKYTGLLFVALPWLANRERAEGDRRARGVRMALLASAVGFVIVTPFALLDVRRFILGAGQEGGNALTGMAGVAVGPLPELWTFHLRNGILPGFGYVGSALALFGFVLALRQARPTARLLSTTVFVLYSVFENSPYKPPPNSDRYLVLLLPFLALLAALALGEIHAWVCQRRRSAAVWIVGALGLLAVGEPLRSTIRLDASMRGDTRETTRQWLVRHACGSQRILLEGALNAGGVLVPSYVPSLPAGCDASYTYSLADDPAAIERYDFVVASSFMYDRFLQVSSTPAAAGTFYRELFAAHEPAATFVPAFRSYGFHNPTIRIYYVRGGDPAGGVSEVP